MTYRICKEIAALENARIRRGYAAAGSVAACTEALPTKIYCLRAEQWNSVAGSTAFWRMLHCSLTQTQVNRRFCMANFEQFEKSWFTALMLGWCAVKPRIIHTPDLPSLEPGCSCESQDEQLIAFI